MSTPLHEARDDDLMAAKARQWRLAFDQSFARAPEEAAQAELVDFLAIRLADTPYALRLGEVAGIQALSGLTACPSARPDLLGLCSFRGNVLPVYDLRILLGHGAGSRAAAWWVVAKEAALGLAFDVFERHLRLAQGACTQRPADDVTAYAGEVLRSDGQARPVVSIASILTDIRASVGT